MKTEHRTFKPGYLRDVTAGIFEAWGAPAAEARIVAEHLVEADLMGHNSHGVVRTIQYETEFKEGRIKPGSPVTVEQETATTAVVDGHLNFGQVCAARLTALAIEKARANGISCISSRNFPHTGRLGAWTTEVAEADMLGIGSVAIPKIAFFGHFVVPWGGREGRFGTNPVSCAAPTAGRPIVVDMSTAAIAEGKIRAARADGSELPADRVLDAEGRPITDPNAFYGPPIGNILPFGHDFGYKAFGLMLMTALMCGSLGGEDIIGEGDHHNAMTLIAISSEAFGDRDGLRRRATELAAYVKSSAPAEGFDGVTLPGELEYATYEERLASGIAIPLDTTWAQICEIADEYGVGHLTKID